LRRVRERHTLRAVIVDTEKLARAPIAGILSIDEGTYVDGRWVPGRRLNGGKNGQGKFLRLGGGRSRNGSIQRVKVYRYR
jgi:hypothetical protein